MGMPCEVNSILNLKPSQGYPEILELSKQYQGSKEDYRIIPVDVPIPLVNEHWVAYADVIIEKLVWENRQTTVYLELIGFIQSLLLSKKLEIR